jgi:GNAT superfamily N-acetyltransferase
MSSGKQVSLPLKIRRYKSSDKDAVHELQYLAFRTLGIMLKAKEIAAEDLDDIRKNYLENGGDFIVGTIDNRIVCMGAFRKVSKTTAEIKRMRVHPDYQRKGLGQLILDKLEEKARQLGYTELCLDTTTKQVPAQKLYKKNGYHEVRREHYAGLEIILYEKNIK